MREIKLTRTMQTALAFANKHGGKLERYPGGFWMEPKHTGSTAKQWFGTSTVHALVTRGVMEYTAWQEGRNFKFPVEASVVK